MKQNQAHTKQSPHKKRKTRKGIDYSLTEAFDSHLFTIRDSGILLVVEGIKDKRALKNLDIMNVFSIDRLPLYKAVELIAKISEKCERQCMILTDLDSEGKKLYAVLNHHLGQQGIRIDNSFREFLFRKTSLRQIEGLHSYLLRNLNMNSSIEK